MNSNSVSSVFHAKRRVQAASKVPRKELPTTLQELEAATRRCQTPKQFRELLECLREFIPYRKLGAVWGYHAHTAIRHAFNLGLPTAFLRWYFSTGKLWTSPVFREWRRTKRAVMVGDVVQRFKADFEPELVKHYKQAGLYHAMCGGHAGSNHFVYFIAAMSSARSGKAHLKQFEQIVPWLVQASQRAYPRTLLTKRETAILERRAMGEITKQIAGAEGISERTVREHLQQIKKKLYTDDLVNAVVIAVRSGMLGRSTQHGPTVHG
ncbi:MAG TPA: LuxR C-terminal-related transcriptional regulator [Nitrospiraceae bacterium]|nr:LuxR C-terminal-related transcriptional regulator [Nitrospiraceae bacterium]